MRFQLRIVDGPRTTVWATGVPMFGAGGLGPSGAIDRGALRGPQPSPLQAATTTPATPEGTARLTRVEAVRTAATVSAPPPGPAGGGCTTWISYKSAPGTAVHSASREFPLSTVARVITGALRGTSGSSKVNPTADDVDPHAELQAFTVTS